MKRFAVVVTLGLALFTGRASASESSWTVCTAGALRACSSIQIITEPGPVCPGATCGAMGVPDGAFTTYLTVRVRNLQGSVDFDNSAVSFLSLWGIRFGGNSASSFGYSRDVVPGTARGSVGSHGLTGIPAWFPGGANGTVRIGENNAYPRGVLGCSTYRTGVASPDPRFPWSGGFQTCDPLGFTGSVEFSFQIGGVWNAADVTSVFVDVQALFGSLDDPNAPYVSTTCDTATANCLVTPEPVTVVLLGTGLLGWGGVGVFRRKKRVGSA